MAYGVNAPFGLRPLSSINGGSWTEKTNDYYIYAPADGVATYNVSLFEGDPVIFNSSLPSTLVGAPTIARYPFDNATIGNQIAPVLGVFVDCEFYDTSNRLVKQPFWPASTAVYPGSRIKANIIDDPNVVWNIQVSTATNLLSDARFSNAAAVPAYFPQNFGFGLGAGGGNIGNPVTGTPYGGSAFYLNIVGTAASNRTNATLPLKALGFVPNPKNTIFASDGVTVNPFLNLKVVINNHIWRVGNLGVTPA